MNWGIKFRLAALGLGAGLMGALIVFITLHSQRQGAALHARLDELNSESFGMAEQFKDALRDVNDKLLRYRTVRDEASWKDFLDASRQLDLWIDTQKPRLKTPGEKSILQQIDSVYDDFQRAAQNLHDQMPSAGLQRPAPPNLPDPLTFSRRRLFDLGQDLAQAHFNLRNQLLAHAHQTLFQFRQTVLGLLGLLFLFGITLAVMVYRDMIMPLRVKLVESQALAERREKLASLGLLAAGVAHEIRNPLTAIKAALFVQKKKFPAATPERDSVEIVEREISRLERIVNNFLQFARPAEPELTTLSADLLLLESQRLFAPQVEKHNIRLKLEPGEPVRIRVDAGQFKQVLINLIQNAADSIGRDGAITLRARTDRKRLANGEMPVVILEVADTGKGIPPEVEKRLFDPFFTTKENGTGLGLSIAARIVQKHGGELQYQTQVNRGTTFGIILPRVIE
ncbi:MAG TPA: ATP-binding protein [Candidatus Sulfopaludibacter sp.]|nr:ATP-binding protein [Candidatus Sulfopaludibacter sp.]